MSALLMKQITEEQTDGAVADAIKGMTPASDDSTLLPEANDPPEMRQAKALARRYRLPFVNLLPQDGDSPIDYSLLSEIPVDLMVRNQFVPLRRENGKLHIAMADPTDLDRLDDLSGALRMRLVPHVATAGAIDIVLRKGDAKSFAGSCVRFSDLAGARNGTGRGSARPRSPGDRQRDVANHQAGRHDHLQRDGVTRLRHSYRNPRHGSAGQVPHRRRAISEG